MLFGSVFHSYIYMYILSSSWFAYNHLSSSWFTYNDLLSCVLLLLFIFIITKNMIHHRRTNSLLFTKLLSIYANNNEKYVNKSKLSIGLKSEKILNSKSVYQVFIANSMCFLFLILNNKSTMVVIILFV